MGQLAVVPFSIANVAVEFAACAVVGTNVTVALSVMTSASKATIIERMNFPDISHLSNLGRSEAWGPPKASL